MKIVNEQLYLCAYVANIFRHIETSVKKSEYHFLLNIELRAWFGFVNEKLFYPFNFYFLLLLKF